MKCSHCKKNGAKKRRQNTNYPNDESNFAILCDDCQKDADEYWREMWDEYYKEVL